MLILRSVDVWHFLWSLLFWLAHSVRTSPEIFLCVQFSGKSSGFASDEALYQQSEHARQHDEEEEAGAGDHGDLHCCQIFNEIFDFWQQNLIMIWELDICHFLWIDLTNKINVDVSTIISEWWSTGIKTEYYGIVLAKSENRKRLSFLSFEIV